MALEKDTTPRLEKDTTPILETISS
jgi:hypothetical protein